MRQKLNNDYYNSKWKKIVQLMQNSNLKLSRIAPAGSRAKMQHRPDSNMDVIFSISGSPKHENFYPELINKLESNFPRDKVYYGSHKNIVHLNFKSGGKFDLVLLPENKFDKEHKSIKDFKRKNL